MGKSMREWFEKLATGSGEGAQQIPAAAETPSVSVKIGGDKKAADKKGPADKGNTTQQPQQVKEDPSLGGVGNQGAMQANPADMAGQPGSGPQANMQSPAGQAAPAQPVMAPPTTVIMCPSTCKFASQAALSGRCAMGKIELEQQKGNIFVCKNFEDVASTEGVSG